MKTLGTPRPSRRSTSRRAGCEAHKSGSVRGVPWFPGGPYSTGGTCCDVHRVGHQAARRSRRTARARRPGVTARSRARLWLPAPDPCCRSGTDRARRAGPTDASGTCSARARDRLRFGSLAPALVAASSRLRRRDLRQSCLARQLGSAHAPAARRQCSSRRRCTRRLRRSLAAPMYARAATELP
jgi:hypothetical protein